MFASTRIKKHTGILILLIFLTGHHVLFASGKREEPPPEPVIVPAAPEIIIEKITELQDRYDSMSQVMPGMVMLGTSAAAMIPSEMISRIDEELSRQLVISGKIKPVLMQKWLLANYFGRKANNPFTLIRALKAENYALPLRFLCKPYLFQCENYFILHVNVYLLEENILPYPVSILRIFETAEDIPSVIGAVLHEMNLRVYEGSNGANKKRIVMNPFKLDFLKLVALDSGEFEFIKTPFIDQYGIPLRDGDDFFSLILGYIFSTTNMYEVMRQNDFADFTLSSAYNSSVTDYVINGRVQLSAELSVLHVMVVDVRNNRNLMTVQFPLHEWSLKNIWNAYREISVKIIESINPVSSYGMVPPLSAPLRGMYVNNMFAGWDEIDNLVLPKGMHEIHTGSYIRSGSPLEGFERPEIVIVEDILMETENEKTDISEAEKPPSFETEPKVNTFYILLDTIDRIFTDREGEYVWNFLNKE